MSSRILIAGGPRVGKSTLARQLGAERGCLVRSTDELLGLGWSEASLAASRWFDEPGPWIVEGVAIPRALRKWFAAHPEGRPCDLLLWSESPRVALTTGQRSMATGCATVLREVLPELVRRGIDVRPFPVATLPTEITR